MFLSVNKSIEGKNIRTNSERRNVFIIEKIADVW
jgi:hypothetical protein